jgi:hypothetical protein
MSARLCVPCWVSAYAQRRGLETGSSSCLIRAKSKAGPSPLAIKVILEALCSDAKTGASYLNISLPGHGLRAQQHGKAHHPFR